MKLICKQDPHNFNKHGDKNEKMMYRCQFVCFDETSSFLSNLALLSSNEETYTVREMANNFLRD